MPILYVSYLIYLFYSYIYVYRVLYTHEDIKLVQLIKPSISNGKDEYLCIDKLNTILEAV